MKQSDNTILFSLIAPFIRSTLIYMISDLFSIEDLQISVSL